MNLNNVAKRYDALTAEERFQLIFAAGTRGDKVEQDRLDAAGKRIKLSIQDHAPFSYALNELVLLTFIAMLESAATYLETAQITDIVEEDAAEDDSEGEPDNDNAGKAEGAGAGDGQTTQSIAGRHLDLVLAEGYMLKTKARGWEVFCERINLPTSFTLMEILPGFDRLKRALDLAKQVAFAPEEVLRWLNRVRPRGTPPATDLPITAESYADSLDKIFRGRVRWWGAE